MSAFANMLAYLVSFTIVICGLVSIEQPAVAAAADITGTWQLVTHHPPPDGDLQATDVLKQDGEKITGTYHGLLGPADVTGIVKANDVTLSVTVQSLTPDTAHFSGTRTSATKMSGTVTGTYSSGDPIPWSAEKK